MKDAGGKDDRLEKYRRAIDQLDDEILRKISERASFAKEVGKIKEEEAGAEPLNFYRPEREAQILRRLIQQNGGPLTNQAVSEIFREIISACLAHESPMQIAFLGPEGTFTQEATLKHFGHSVAPVSKETIEDVFKAVASGNSDYGVVPLENSTEGAVNNTLDNFLTTKLKICGEIKIKISHCFLTSYELEGNVREIYAHQQTLAQCRNWLNSNYPGIPRIPATSNAEAARFASESKDVGAVASRIAGEIYGLRNAVEGIEDQVDNTTRFVVLGRESVPPSGSDKTTILVSTRNEPGALFGILEPFQLHGISLTSVETRPSRDGIWSYVFFIDFEGHVNDSLVEKVLDEVKVRSLNIRLLGSYPKAVIYE